MLNKKAQVEDNLEIVISMIGIIVGIVIISLAQADYKYNLEKGKEAVSIESSGAYAYDTKFLAMDLLNTLKLPIGDYTVGELMAYMPRNSEKVQDPELFEGILWDKWLVNGIACNTELYHVIDDYLRPVYGRYWSISVYQGEKNIFTCQSRDLLYGAGSQIAEMNLPSLDPQQDLKVSLEVYQ